MLAGHDASSDQGGRAARRANGDNRRAARGRARLRGAGARRRSACCRGEPADEHGAAGRVPQAPGGVVWRRAEAALEARYHRRVQSVGIQSFQVVRAEQIWGALRRSLDGARVLAIIVIGFVYLQYVLGLFPWTRGTGNRLVEYVLTPLGTMAQGLVVVIPDLLFLAVLFL